METQASYEARIQGYKGWRFTTRPTDAGIRLKSCYRHGISPTNMFKGLPARWENIVPGAPEMGRRRSVLADGPTAERRMEVAA